MKKLLSAFCLVLCLHTFGKAPSELTAPSAKLSGEKQLVKALIALVNREGNKKVRFRRIELFSAESPWL